MAVFAITMVPGPHWDANRERRQQRGWAEHAAFMDGLVQDGLVILGGPVGAERQVLLAAEAADERELETRLGEDPWASMGLLRIGEIRPWSIWLDGRARR